jgi:hypothetical protein
MSSLVGFLLALLAQIMVLPTAFQSQQQAAMTATLITTAQEQQQILNAAQAWISQNLTAVEATATAATAMPITVATLAAANVGLPATFSATNPFGQTWQVQVLQPSAGNLQILVLATGGQALTDLQAAGIAANVGQPGGFIPQNDSGVYPLGAARVYGNQANYNISTTGYSGVTGGHPAALLVMNNGQVQNNSLYRVAVPGQPQLNQMQTAIDMNSNNVNNANAVNAQKVVLPGSSNATSLQVGNSFFYGDPSNSAIRQNGGLYIQNLAGTGPAPIAQVSDINSSGTVTAVGAQINGNANVAGTASMGTANIGGGGANIAGNTTMADGTQIYNPGTQFIETGGGNLYLKPWNGSGVTVVGGGGGSGHLITTGRMESQEYIQVDGAASQGAGCSPNGMMGNSGSGPLFCVSGVWKGLSAYNGTYSGGSASGTTGWVFNGSPNAISIQAWGGSNPAASGNGANPCQLAANVNGVGTVANHTDNNDQLAKACSISFVVPSGAQWSITSNPYEGNVGVFTFAIFTPTT